MKNKILKYLLLCLLSTALGFISGAIIWAILKVINVLTDVIWDIAPEYINVHPLVYNLIICCIGALLIYLIARKFGDLPHLTEEVMEIIDKKGGYPYNKLGICVVAAIIPLIFGGTLGPEAGLVGIIAGLCCWVGDNLKYRKEKLQTLAETGFSIALGIVFMTPLAGIVSSLEPNNKKEHYGKKLKQKAGRIIVYCLGVAGGFIAFIVLGNVWEIYFPGFGSGGLPRFEKDFFFDPQLLLWAIPLIAIGILTGLFSDSVNKVFEKARKLFKKNRIIPLLLTAVILATCGYFYPDAMFSGEHQLGHVISNYQDYGLDNLIIVGILKIILVYLCINLGWRGGAIFPLVAGASFFAFAFALVVGINGNFAAAVCIAASFAYTTRKPVMVTALFMLCFPPTYIPLIFVCALIASKVPNPLLPKEKGNAKKPK